MLTLFQTATLEGWPDLMYQSLEVQRFSWIFFVIFIILNSLVFMNMIIGVIIDVIVKANENDAPENITLLKDISERLKKIENTINSIMNEFKPGDIYIDRGPNYKRFDDDQFSSWLVDNSNKTIPPIGGIRFKQFVNLEIYSSEIPDQKIPPYIILISSFIDSEFNNPWNDEITDEGNIIYWGDANGRKNNHMSYPGNKAIKNVSFF